MAARRAPRLTDRQLKAAIEACCERIAGESDDLSADDHCALVEAEIRLKEIRDWRAARREADIP